MRGVLAAAAALLVAACVPGPAGSWRVVDLAGAGSVTTLATTASGLLVATSTDGRPGLLALDAAGRPTPVALTPTSPYGAIAALEWASWSPGGIVAVGGVRGGAHGNVRWTVWQGSGRGASSGSDSSAGPPSEPSAGSLGEGLAELPQPFETFGGWDAGALVGVAAGPRGPVIAGSWRGTVGLDIALWTRTGVDWVRLPTPAGLASDASTLRTPSGVAATASEIVIVGNEVELSGAVTQRPVAWSAPDAAGPWTRVPLPGGPGRASSVGCGAASCVIVGLSSDATVRAWRLDGVGASELRLPPLVLDDPAPVPAPAVAADVAWLALPSGGRATMVRADAAGASAVETLDGTPIAVATNGGRVVYVAVRDAASRATLWRLGP